MTRFGVLLVLSVAACGSESLEPPPPTADAFSPGGYADTLIGLTTAAGGEPTTCTDSLPECGTGTLSTGSCPANAALGMNDGVGYTIPPMGILEVAFRCGQIVEHASTDGTVSLDFAVWATVPADAEVQVELSYDGSTFVAGYPIASEPGDPDKNRWPFDLSRTPDFVQFARFVRIVDHGGTGGIVVDAVEAF